MQAISVNGVRQLFAAFIAVVGRADVRFVMLQLLAAAQQLNVPGSCTTANSVHLPLNKGIISEIPLMFHEFAKIPLVLAS
jgi:hypothetical protein